jgi:hypothetical protein
MRSMLQERRGFVVGLWTAGVAVGSAGCTTAEPLTFGAVPAFEDMVIRTPDGHVYKGEPGLIEVTGPLPNGPGPSASVSISGADRNGQGITVSFDLSITMLHQDAWTVPLEKHPGGGTLAYVTSAGPRIVGPGKLVVSMHDGTVRGRFEASDSVLPVGYIEGHYAVSCLVSPEMLGGESNGEPSGGSWVLVEDVNKQTEFCRTFGNL